MKTRHQFRLTSICLFLLIAIPVFGQSLYQNEAEARAGYSRRDFASLSLQIDRQGGAHVTLWLPVKPDDPGRVKRALAESLGFPLEFDREQGSLNHDPDDETGSETEHASWFFSSGHCDKAFMNEGLKSTGRINFYPLVGVLRPLMLQLLVVGVTFDKETPNLSLTGAKQVLPSANYYQTQFNLFASAPSDMEFSWGYTTADILWKFVPLSVFLLIPALLTLWMSWSVLKIQDQAAEVWGRYFRFLYRLINLIWLIWIPVCSLSNFGDIISTLVGRDHRVVGETLSLTSYFAPPLVVVYLCHFLSGRVYRYVRGTEWSPREVVSRAILANAFSILPLFFLLLTVNTFIAGTRHAGVFLVVGIGFWFIWAQFASKAFNLSTYAVTSGELRDRVFDLAQRAGITLKQIYVLPETKAQMSNAFARSDNAVMITGSLLKHLSKREVDGIMAHEIGHLKEKHPQRQTWVMLITIVVTNVVVSALASIIHLQRSTPVIFSLGLAAAMLVVHFVSRSNERHADTIAVSLTGDPEAFISGLAKLSRLNLMPLHSGGWGESLESHPRTMRRLNDLARLHCIPAPRLEELLATSDLPESHYAATEVDEVQGKIFSTDFKKKYTVRTALVLLATILFPPLLFAFLLTRSDLDGAALAIAYASGLIVTFGFYQIVRNFISCWGQGSLEKRLRTRLKQQGFAEAARDGIAVGLSPAAETRKYENYLFWDIGVLWLTKDKLYYFGEESQFAFERRQIQDVYLDKSRAEWLPDKNLYLRWYDPQREVSDTIHFLALGPFSVLQARRQLGSLHERVRDWLNQNGNFPIAPETLPVLSAPATEAITSEPASNTFNFGLLLKASIQMCCISGVLSFALRLSFSGALYAMAVAVLIGFIDESPKLFHHPRLSEHDGAAKPQPTSEYQAAAWADSNVATVTQDIP